MDRVILQTPLLLIGFGKALALSVLGIVKRAGYVLHIAAAAVFVAMFALSLLWGAGMQEVLIVTLVFLALSMTGYAGGDKR